MRRTAFFLILASSLLSACSDHALPPNIGSYQLVGPPTGSVSVRQDRVISMRDSGLMILRDGTIPLDGNPENPTTQPNPRLTFAVENPEIALIDTYGIVRGVTPGTSRVTARGYGQEISFDVTVVPHPVSQIILTVATRPNGRLVPAAQRADTGTMWALPGDRRSAFIEAVVLGAGGPSDTVYCNRCPRVSTANGGPRIQRLVNFRSLRPEIATVRNANNPFIQSTDATIRNTDSAGRVLALDTLTSEAVPIVFEVPGDGLSDTVYIKFALRPIDTLTIDADSGDFPPNDIDDIGTQRRKYPNSDSLGGNFFNSAVANFAVRADYVFFVWRNPGFNLGDPTNPSRETILRIGQTTDPERLRNDIPLVSWASALPVYLDLTPTDFNKASVLGQCYYVAVACQSPSSQTARNALVINCNDTAAKLPGLDANGRPWGGLPLQFGGQGSYTVPNCATPRIITPYPGALCTSANLNDWTSFCTIWVRASIIDPATGLTKTDLYPINVRATARL